MSDTLPPGATVYYKRPLPTQADGLPPFLTRELGVVERAIRDTRVRRQRTVTDDHAIVAEDEYIYADATGGAITVTLPDVRRYWGYEFGVKRLNAGGGAVTVDGDGATIDGGATATLSTQYEAVTLVSDGTQWWVV